MTKKLQQPQKIAVLGGGMAALTTVFELTNQPNWQDNYEITVYQMGWRLGGKGASGRNPQCHDRIEEHGLHVFMGVYENTFQVIRQCYQELNRPPGSPLATWTDAFKPENFIAFPEPVNGERINWAYDFPDNADLPGDGNGFPDIWGYVCLLVKFMQSQVEGSFTALEAFVESDNAQAETLPNFLETWLDEKQLTPDWSHPVREVAYLQMAQQIIQVLPRDPKQHQTGDHEALIWFLNRFRQGFWDMTEGILAEHHKFRRLWILIDLACTVITGIIADGLLFSGFDPIDDYDLREWLIKQGASDLSANSVMIRGIYDFVFGYEDGDVNQPNFAAGVGLRCWLRMTLTYRGAFVWKMQAGMGDVIFAPLYEVLKRRGVQFKFFHRVKHLGLSEDRGALSAKGIAQIFLGRQATLKGEEYFPLVDVKGLPCWSSIPDYDQLVEGEILKAKDIHLESAWTTWKDVEEITLNVGQDFDQVVLGISIAALKHICSDLISTCQDWRNMVEKIKTNQTQALQVWMRPTLPQLGWSLPSPLLDGYEHPYNSWADMTHLLEKESWSGDNQPGSLAYFCGPLPDAEIIPPFSESGFPQQEYRRVEETARSWFETHISRLWSAMQSATGFNWHWLVDPREKEGSERFTSQYYRANIDPTERYVLAVKGSIQYRLQVDESGFSNLYLAGDWTRNGINMGSIESAVISGRQAARAICGYPQIIPGESDL
jgi:uncharacterized protein with NAD-binding domain and iron-sulfur cluster